MKVEVKPSKGSGTKTRDMKVGDVARVVNRDGLEPNRYGTYLLKTWGEYVSLQDPSDTWDYDPNFPVEILSPGSVITLTITDPEEVEEDDE